MCSLYKPERCRCYMALSLRHHTCGTRRQGCRRFMEHRHPGGDTKPARCRCYRNTAILAVIQTGKDAGVTWRCPCDIIPVEPGGRDAGASWNTAILAVIQTGKMPVLQEHRHPGGE
ncbi:MAG: hypothetical protein ACOC31_01840 [Bacteroidota bacterium]